VCGDGRRLSFRYLGCSFSEPNMATEEGLMLWQLHGEGRNGMRARKRDVDTSEMGYGSFR